MKLINNQDIRLIQELVPLLGFESEVMFCLSYFSIEAIFAMADALASVKSIKVVVDAEPETEIRFGYDDGEWKLYNDLLSRHKANTNLTLLKDKAQVRLGKTGGNRFIIVNNPGASHVFTLSPKDLNSVSLGISPSGDPILIVYTPDTEAQYQKIFKQFWDNGRKDVTAALLGVIEKAGKIQAPEYLYKFSLFNIFKTAIIPDDTEERLKQTGFKNTAIWEMLYNFQQDAVLGAIQKIETFGGCIIADSVGLGKTFEALAVMKYYQLRNDRVLVLCPKKLRDNWLVYSLNDVRNILAKDRFNFDVLNHTDLSRTNGFSGDINLNTVNWGNYDMVVIDESHNFRNNPAHRDTLSRYKRLMDDIIKQGVKTKVLMLSATPVNTRMNDIKNQIAFITEQNDTALAEHGITSIDQTLRKAQQQFNRWLNSSRDGSFHRDTLIDALPGDYFRMLDLLTIARSRKHIRKYYNMADIGKFPDRMPPRMIRSDFDVSGQFPAIDRVNDDLNSLKLNFYSPLSYVRPDRRAEYEKKYDIKTVHGTVFRQIDRERSLIHLIRVNLLKRLESSIQAFRLTLEAILNNITVLEKKIAEAQANGTFEEGVDINTVDLDDPEMEDLLLGGKTRVLLQDIDQVKCLGDLEDDRRKIENLLAGSLVIDAERDAKLKDLKQLIEDKLANPINAGNRKVIIFSAFADTAKYLYAQLAAWLKEKHGISSALVTGGDGNKTNMPECRTDLSSILTHFSPVSKKRAQIFPDAVAEIDVLFCTDCISEGQNLQDCDFLVNYDIHWNPVRIIQRFGRIDRIGSKNDCIQLINFFPNLDLDGYINLIGRVQGRMQILDVSATGDDNVLQAADANQDLEYRRRQLEQLQNAELDLEDMEGGISITDLTFNDYKIDADRLGADERLELEAMPKAIFSVTAGQAGEIPQGVIFCLKDLNGDSEDGKGNNAIYPYYLIYIKEGGELFIQANNPKRCLDYFKKLCSGKTHVLPELEKAFDKETKGGARMDKYTDLLEIVHRHLGGVEQERGLDSLSRTGGTFFGKAKAKGDYQIISYLIIR